MTKLFQPRHSEVAEPQQDRFMHNLVCCPASGSSESSHLSGRKLLTNFTDCKMLKRVQHDKTRRAFTLAEVLITLAIIGVVAAMTIPTLIANYQEKSWTTASQVFERKLTEAMKVMNVNGTLAGHTTTQSFVDELSKNFKVTKTCDSNNLKNCVPETVTWNIIDITNGGSESETLNLASLKTSADLGKSGWNTETIGVQFANGTSAIMAYNPDCVQDPYSNQIKGTSCIAILYDTTGFKSPNTTGKDIRGYNNKVSNAAFKIGSRTFGTPMYVEPLSKAECESMISTHGIFGCYYDGSDYWAGAVKQCGHVNKMATKQDLADLANYLYNVDNIGATDSTGTDLSLASDKATALGFKLQMGYFAAWSNDNAGTWTCNYRVYSDFGSIWYASEPRFKGNSNHQVLCLAE